MMKRGKACQRIVEERIDGTEEDGKGDGEVVVVVIVVVMIIMPIIIPCL